MDFITNPNQRRITYRKIAGTTGYTKININAARQAMSTLSYSAFMLYCYMALNADNYEEWFSPAILIQRTNLTESTYRKAFSELLDSGTRSAWTYNKQFVVIGAIWFLFAEE